MLHEHERPILSLQKNILQISWNHTGICEPVIMCLKDLGFDAKFSPLNDIIVDNKKVSGDTQTKQDILLQHGTILLDVDVNKMFSVLKYF